MWNSTILENGCEYHSLSTPEHTLVVREYSDGHIEWFVILSGGVEIGHGKAPSTEEAKASAESSVK